MKKISPYLYILPALIIVIAFRFIPILFSFIISFYEWTVTGPKGFIGLANYERLLYDSSFWQSMLNTFYLVLYVVPATIIFSLIFANLLNGIERLKSFFRSLYFIPVVTSLVAVSIVWKLMLNQQNGVINFLIGQLGIEGLAWLTESRGIVDLFLSNFGFNFTSVVVFFSNLTGMAEKTVYLILGGPSLALFSIIMMSIWKSLGYNTIIYLAGLQNIPQGYYEAAEIDGASKFKQFLKITLPLISPTTFYVLMMTTITTFQVFSQIYLMTGPPIGGPEGTTSVIVYYIFKKGYDELNMSYASAVALVLFMIILTLTLLQKKLEKKVHY
ncbi:MAG: sugar ABC transporter permease [Candidatus Cloacimonetes bacterium]|nr:sugar ABC transporter permease [Candidatus Cloacimonadota bacterium]